MGVYAHLVRYVQPCNPNLYDSSLKDGVSIQEFANNANETHRKL